MPNTLADLLPYYPNEKYLAKNFAPEKIPMASLRELAAAQVAAVKSGVLSPVLAQKFLANVLVEGRSGADKVGKQVGLPDFGFNDMGYAPTPEMNLKMQQMGLSVGRRTAEPPPESADWGDQEWYDWDKVHQVPATDVLEMPGRGYSPNYEDDSTLGFGSNAERIHARLAALMLAHKAKLYGEDKAIERWNGVGPGARNHAAKVETMQRMLAHPANAPLMKTYMQMLMENSQPPVPTGVTLRSMMR